MERKRVGIVVFDDVEVLDFCGLTVVARCHGEAVARATAMHMEYPYPETLERRA